MTQLLTSGSNESVLSTDLLDVGGEERSRFCFTADGEPYERMNADVECVFTS